ncbi:tRNA-uridine aminocarboxypropyltransferase [Shewanella woodyi]|uniref:tRNA-uridine aminocarboxypropyltransferase n=1 Tax=Shewanella woodyi (strain ATCC 51908 / MS32) TaxID=392500 RepID=B1KF68_SHEWM|nr:DTW domain-containing protein [Shewanella woodyi]ACA86609.1 DTW domain containing protein [Shewanella woodyi ATCC 51908]
MSVELHAIHKLYQYRKAISSRPYGARGKNLVRCELCLLAKVYCTCESRRQLVSNNAFLLIMYDDEVLKPSNSGRLIADLIPDTHAYIWSRTYANRKMMALIEDPNYQPFIIFPGEYANEEQQVLSKVEPSSLPRGKKPLFILLDGSWREAIRMFRKSPYLHHLPMLSFTPDTVAKYGLRKGSRDFQLGTAEVAALALGAAGEPDNAASLNRWFELFIESSIFSRSRKSTHDLTPLTKLREAFLTSLDSE